MKYVIVYWSRYGNGKKIVETLDEKLKENGNKAQVYKTDELNPASMPEADCYIFSAPAEAFNIQKNMRSFMKKLQGMEDEKYGIINTHGMNRNWLGKMEKLLSKKKMIKTAEVSFQVGKNAKEGDAIIGNWEEKLDGFVKELN